MTRDTVTYIELAAGGRQDAPAGKHATAHMEDLARRGQDYEHEDVGAGFPTIWEIVALAILCAAAVSAILYGFHWLLPLEAGVIYN